MQQVNAADGAKRRSAPRPQRVFHDEHSLFSSTGEQQPANDSDALSVRQGALSAGTENPLLSRLPQKGAPMALGLVAALCGISIVLMLFVSLVRSFTG